MKQFRCNLKAILNNLLRIYCTYQQLFLFFNDTIFVWFVTIFDLFVSNWVTPGQNMVVRIGRHVQPFCSSRKQFIFTARSTHWALVTTRKTKQTDKTEKMDVTSTLKRYPQPPFVSEDTSAIMVVISRLTQLLNEKAT